MENKVEWNLPKTVILTFPEHYRHTIFLQNFFVEYDRNKVLRAPSDHLIDGSRLYLLFSLFQKKLTFSFALSSLSVSFSFLFSGHPFLYFLRYRNTSVQFTMWKGVNYLWSYTFFLQFFFSSEKSYFYTLCESSSFHFVWAGEKKRNRCSYGNPEKKNWRSNEEMEGKNEISTKSLSRSITKLRSLH